MSTDRKRPEDSGTTHRNGMFAPAEATLWQGNEDATMNVGYRGLFSPKTELSKDAPEEAPIDTEEKPEENYLPNRWERGIEPVDEEATVGVYGARYFSAEKEKTPDHRKAPVIPPESEELTCTVRMDVRGKPREEKPLTEKPERISAEPGERGREETLPPEETGDREKKKKGVLWLMVFGGVLLLGVIGVLLLGLRSPSDSEEVPEETTTAGIHIYEVITDDIDWTSAQEEASTRGGHLVTFDTEAEYAYVLSLLTNMNKEHLHLWIGAGRDGSQFYWIDGKGEFYGSVLNSPDHWIYPFWGETQEQYGQMYYSRELQKWIIGYGPNGSNDATNGTGGYIIEWD